MKHQCLRFVSVCLITCLLAENVAFALNSKKVAYFGGTASAFAQAKEPVEGSLDTSNEQTLLFQAEEKPFKGELLTIPYANVTDLEYGQKAGRRVGTAVATTVLLGPIGLISLFSKKRKHFLTISYKDEAHQDQVVVLELGKDTVRTTLAIVKTRSGREIIYQDDEARKAGTN